MKEEINKNEVAKFNHTGNIFTILCFVCVVSFIPLLKFLKLYGIIIWACIYAVTMFWAFKVQKITKVNDICTYKEIVAFTEGKKLDEIQKQQEIGKRPYQTVLKLLAGAIVGAIVGAIALAVL